MILIYRTELLLSSGGFFHVKQKKYGKRFICVSYQLSCASYERVCLVVFKTARISENVGLQFLP